MNAPTLGKTSAVLAALAACGLWTGGPAGLRAADAETSALPAALTAGSFAMPARFKADSGPGGTPDAPEAIAPAAGPWWSLFRDPTLNRLETQALGANQDLRLAVDRVLEARAQAGAASSGLYPTVTAPLEASRQRTTNTGPVATSRLVGSNFFPPPAGVTQETFAGQVLSSTYNDFQAPLTVGYEVDAFGRIRHARDQARAYAQASLADREGVRLSLTSQVAETYFALRAADSAVAVLEAAVRLRADAEQIQERRVRGGAASDVDLLRARVEKASTDADLLDAVQARAERENALAELCGQPASAFRIDPMPLDPGPPPAVPATIPAQVLARRPDLVEAERRIAATGEGVKAARARLFPVFSVNAGYGFESTQTNQLLENQSRAWSIAGAISIPIFDGGLNASDLRAAHARDAQAFDAYRETALRALRETEDALGNLRERALQADARLRAAEDARRVYDASQQSYAQGATPYFEVIDAQRVLLNAELAQVRTLGIRYAATVELIRATGGDCGEQAENTR